MPGGVESSFFLLFACLGEVIRSVNRSNVAMPFDFDILYAPEEEPIDPAIKHAILVFPAWSNDVAEQMLRTITGLIKDVDRFDDEENHNLASRSTRFIGSIDQVIEGIHTWVNEAPTHIAQLMGDQVLQEKCPSPDLVFKINGFSSFCSVSPYLLNFPEIDFGIAGCYVSLETEKPRQYLLKIPTEKAWSCVRELSIDMLTMKLNRAAAEGRIIGLTLPHDFSDTVTHQALTLDEAVAMLSSGDYMEMLVALEALSDCSDPQAVCAVISVVEDTSRDPSIRGMAAQTLATMHDPRVIELLLRIAANPGHDDWHFLANMAFSAVMKIADPSVNQLALHVAKHANHYSPEWSIAVSALGRCSDPQALAYLMALASRDPAVFQHEIDIENSHQRTDCTTGIRLVAIRALAEMGDPQAIPLLHDLWQSSYDENRYAQKSIRLASALALVRFGDEEPMEHTLVRWERDSTYPKYGGKLAFDLIAYLKQLGDRRWVPILIYIMRFPDRENEDALRHESAQALTAITGQHYGEVWAQWRDWWAKEIGFQLKARYTE